MNILVSVFAFFSEYLDSSLGMGYGTALSPILIIMGFEPLKVIPAILISQLATDIATCILHHNIGNLNLNIGSQDFKAAFVLGAISSIGAVVAVITAVSLPKRILFLYIGFLVLAIGILVIYTAKRPIRFSWRKLMSVSLLASFNKGISGGGYGPLVMGGQMPSGVNVKNAVGITAFAETLTRLVGFIVYLAKGKALDWKLINVLVISAILAVPFAALTVKKVQSVRLKMYVGFLMIILGLFTLLKIVYG